MTPSLLSPAIAAFHEEALETLGQIEKWVVTSSQQPSGGNSQQQATRRLLHSLKGTAASFGNEPIEQVCHAIESFLEDKQQLSLPDSETLLTAIDYCRHALSDSESSPEMQTEKLASCIALLNSQRQDFQEPRDAKIIPEINGAVWQIDFAPHQQFFENGHDPLRIIKALRNLGPIKVSVFTDKLPDFADLNPFQCYLRWQITLKAELDYQQLASQFEWVKHLCELTIDLLALPQRDRTIEPNRYKLNQANLDALLTVSQMLQTQLHKSYALTDQLTLTDKVRLSRRNHEMKRQQLRLQQQLLKITMRPLADAFGRLPRMAFDLGKKTNKPVQLHMDIAPIELDSLVINSLLDPLMHLLRNALAHGIESADLRQQAGKPICGQIYISAEQVDEQLLIRFSDDGAGLSEQQILAKARKMGIYTQNSLNNNQQLSEWVFRAGFSTSQSMDAISGRGIGLDVVKQHITELGGRIELVSTKHKGCCFTIQIPVQHAIVDVQLVRIADQTLALPLVNVMSSCALDSNRLVWLNGKQWFITDDNHQIPLIDIGKFLQFRAIDLDDASTYIVVMKAENIFFAVRVNSLAEQTQLLIKSLRTHYRHLDGIKGVAILPEGNMALLLEPGRLLVSNPTFGDH